MEGIQRMVEEDRYCIDVMHQVAAVEGALDKVGHLVLASHVDTCVATALKSGKPQERKEKLDELMEIFSRQALRGQAKLGSSRFLPPPPLKRIRTARVSE